MVIGKAPVVGLAAGEDVTHCQHRGLRSTRWSAARRWVCIGVDVSPVMERSQHDRKPSRPYSAARTRLTENADATPTYRRSPLARLTHPRGALECRSNARCIDIEFDEAIEVVEAINIEDSSDGGISTIDQKFKRLRENHSLDRCATLMRIRAEADGEMRRPMATGLLVDAGRQLWSPVSSLIAVGS